MISSSSSTGSSCSSWSETVTLMLPCWIFAVFPEFTNEGIWDNAANANNQATHLKIEASTTKGGGTIALPTIKKIDTERHMKNAIQ